jgi:hypothetical protein
MKRNSKKHSCTFMLHKSKMCAIDLSLFCNRYVSKLMLLIRISFLETIDETFVAP